MPPDAVSDNQATTPPAKRKPSDFEIQEAMFGFKKDTEFSSAIQESVVPGRLDTDSALTARRAMLMEHGLSFEPLACPDNWALDKLTEQDWQEVHEASDPFLALWSRANLLRNQAVATTHKNLHTGRLPGEAESKEAYTQSLPLVHGTTVEGLKTALTHGSFVSNRMVHETGGDALVSGNTNLEDRLLGLDNYVFADFARPHMYRMQAQPEVTVVLDPRVMDQPGAFITEKDIADCLENKQYLRGLSVLEDFYSAVKAKIAESKVASQQEQPQSIYGLAGGADSDMTNLGTPSFSTWEVKLPSVDIGSVKEVIFRDKEAFDAFIQEFGTSTKAVYQPDLANNLKELFIDDRYEEVYADLIEKDYQKRIEELEHAPDVEEVYMSMGKALEDPQSIDRAILPHSNPQWLSLNLGTRPTKEELIHLMKNPRLYHNFNGGTYYGATRVAIAKLRYSKSKRCGVMVSHEWIDWDDGYSKTKNTT